MSLSLQHMERALQLVNWSPEELARRARASIVELEQWRRGEATPTERTLTALQSAFEAEGVSFGPSGVELGGSANDAQSIGVDQMNSANDE